MLFLLLEKIGIGYLFSRIGIGKGKIFKIGSNHQGESV